MKLGREMGHDVWKRVLDISDVVIRACLPEKLMVFENEAARQGTSRGKAFPEHRPWGRSVPGKAKGQLGRLCG